MFKHFPDWRPIPRIDSLANVPERATPYHGLYPSVPDLQQKDHGSIREQPVDNGHSRTFRHVGNPLEHRAAFSIDN